MIPKKRLEQYFVSVLQRHVAECPQGDIVEHDGPDALIRHAEGVLGVEVTTIFAPGEPELPPPQAQEAEGDLVVERAQALAKAHNVPPVMVDVFFRDNEILTKRGRQSLTEALVQIVVANMPAVGGHVSVENRYDNKMPAQLEAIFIRRLKPLVPHLWQSAGAGIVCQDFAPLLQAAIDDKNGKLPAYRTKCSSCWLLIVADWSGPAAFFEMSPTMAVQEFHSLFDRTFFLESGRERVTEIRRTSNIREI